VQRRATSLPRKIESNEPPWDVREFGDDAAMPLASLHDVFIATAGVAGTLIGLLFVAISVAHDRLTAEDEGQAHRVRASAALTAFTNALSVSLFALVFIDIGWTALAVSVAGLLFVVASLMSLRRVRRSQPGELRGAGFLAILVITFAVQLFFGLMVILHPHDRWPVQAIAVLVIVCFWIGIARSWELIGAPSIGLRGEIGAIAHARRLQSMAGEPAREAAEAEEQDHLE